MNAGHPSDSFVRFSRALAGRIRLLCGGIALLLAGCATTREAKVASPAQPNVAASVSYVVEHRHPLVADASLRDDEATAMLKTALARKGFYEAAPHTKADLIVAMDYGVGPPQTKNETLSEPVYITIPGQVRTERAPAGTDAQGRPSDRTVSVQDPPTTEFAGFRERAATIVTYEKYLKLSARENQEPVDGRPAPARWEIDVTSEGESPDLRKNLPLLLAASADYIGKDFRGQKTIRLKDAPSPSDATVAKKGL